MAILAVPLMALVIPPVQAAGIMLPILLVMDLISLWAWRGHIYKPLLLLMLPGAIIGIALGWLTASYVNDAHIRLLVGLIGLIFFLQWFYLRFRKLHQAAQDNRAKGFLCGILSGLTSFIAHAGGPPYQIYALPLRHDPKLYTGTSVIFFATLNAIKVVPYFALGQFDGENLLASASLIPVAMIATLFGVWIVRRMKPEIFYPFMYVTLFLVSLKLIGDGIKGFL